MLASISTQPNTTSLYLIHKKKQKQYSWLKKLNEAIEESFNNFKCTIPQLAAALYMSERQLFRSVKKHTNMTPNDYLTELRMQHAKKLIQTGDYNTLKEIAFEMGYKRSDYFARIFEQRFQIHPLDMLHHACRI